MEAGEEERMSHPDGAKVEPQFVGFTGTTQAQTKYMSHTIIRKKELLGRGKGV